MLLGNSPRLVGHEIKNAACTVIFLYMQDTAATLPHCVVCNIIVISLEGSIFLLDFLCLNTLYSSHINTKIACCA